MFHWTDDLVGLPHDRDSQYSSRSPSSNYDESTRERNSTEPVIEGEAAHSNDATSATIPGPDSQQPTTGLCQTQNNIFGGSSDGTNDLRIPGSNSLDAVLESGDQLLYQSSNITSEDLTKEDAQRTVYYFADSITSIGKLEERSVFADKLRAVMVVKWMRFYCYYPHWPKDVDKPRRDELKSKLKLPAAYGQRLAIFIINRFNSFKKLGLVAVDESSREIKYHDKTDVWLSQAWDGNIEGLQENGARLSRSPNSKRALPEQTLSKWSALKQRPAGRKRPRLANPRDESNLTMEKTDMVIDPGLANHARTELARKDGSDTTNQRDFQAQVHVNQCREIMTASKPNDTVIDLTVTEYNSESQADTTLKLTKRKAPLSSTSFECSTRAPLLNTSAMSMPDPTILSARLEQVAMAMPTSRASDIINSRDVPSSAPLDAHVKALNERLHQLKGGIIQDIQELEIARNSHSALEKRRKDLIEEVRATIQQARETRQQIKSAAPPNASSETFQQLYQKSDDDKWIKSMTLRKAEISDHIKAASQLKAALKNRIAEQKLELQQLQRSVQKRMDDDARLRNLEGALRNLDEPDSSERGSGTVSPAESLPDVVPLRFDD